MSQAPQTVLACLLAHVISGTSSQPPAPEKIIEDECYKVLEANLVSGISNNSWAKGMPFHYYRPSLTK